MKTIGALQSVPFSGELGDALALPHADAMKVAEEIFALSDLVKTDARLRRALTDPSRNAEDKTQLAHSLFNAHMSAPGLQVLGAKLLDAGGAHDFGDDVEFAAAQGVVYDEAHERLAVHGQAVGRRSGGKARLAFACERRIEAEEALVVVAGGLALEIGTLIEIDLGAGAARAGGAGSKKK